MPRSAWRFHQLLSPKYEQWAQARLDSKRAIELSTSNILGTEWPLFGSVFYLWAAEALQDAWEKTIGHMRSYISNSFRNAFAGLIAGHT